MSLLWQCCWLARSLVSPKILRKHNAHVRPTQVFGRDAARQQARAGADRSGARRATSSAKQPDKAAAYYHFMMAHMYEEMVSMYGRSDYATKAIEEYRLAIENDPSFRLPECRTGGALRQDRPHSRRRAGSAGHPEARRQ